MQKALFFRAIVVLIFITSLSSLSNAQSTVTFYANISDTGSESGWVGHVWIGLNDGTGTEQVVGFYPGGLQDDSGRNANIDFTFSVQSIAPARRVLEKYSEQGYILGIRDCRAFANDVAAAVGLRTPSSIGVKSPAIWMAELIELNP